MVIVITLPFFFPKEAEEITCFFQDGLERLHLRKPESTVAQVRELLSAIPAQYHSRIVIHEHFELLQEFNLAGVHLNRRNPEAPAGWKGHISISCHSLLELEARKKEGFDYLSLSPIYNSISKQGYEAAFSVQDLQDAHAKGLIDSRVMALGGICKENMAEVLSYGFGGVMILGYAWRNSSAFAKVSSLPTSTN